MYKIKGLPEPNEITMCTVKKILFHSVFVELDEYEHLEGMIHISEIAPGMIRNIRDFVREGKKIVCKVLKINHERNHIDLSLRRVSRSEALTKNYEFKQDIKATKLLDTVANKLKKNTDAIYKEVGIKLIEVYGSLNSGLWEISEDNSKIKNLNLTPQIEKILLETIIEKIKKQEVSISGTIELSSTAPDGIIKIKKVLNKLVKDNVKINYISAPKYKITITASDYKIAENEMNTIKENLMKISHEENCTSDLVRDKKR